MAAKIQKAKEKALEAKSEPIRGYRLPVYMTPDERAVFDNVRGRDKLGPTIIRLALAKALEVAA